MAATQFAADTPLLVTGLIATGGIFLLWRLWIYGLAFLLMGFVFAIGDDRDWLRLSIMASVSTAAAVGITFVTPRTGDAVLVQFYERVRPVGWWSKTARATGHRAGAPLSALLVRLRAAAFCALSLFLLLVGFGKLLLHPPWAPPSSGPGSCSSAASRWCPCGGTTPS